MHKRERYLPHEGGAPQLGIEQGADGHRYRIIRERARNTEEKKVLDGCFAILEKKMRRDSQAPVTNCRNGGPCPPPPCYGVKKNDFEKGITVASIGSKFGGRNGIRRNRNTAVQPIANLREPAGIENFMGCLWYHISRGGHGRSKCVLTISLVDTPFLVRPLDRIERLIIQYSPHFVQHE